MQLVLRHLTCLMDEGEDTDFAYEDVPYVTNPEQAVKLLLE